MNKKSLLYYYDGKELDLIKLIQVIWHGKIKLLLIIAISFFLGFVYSYSLPKNYLASLTIDSRYDNSSFDKLNYLSGKLTQNTIKFQNKMVINELHKELKDYQEFLLSLKNTKKIKEKFKGLTIEDQKKELKKYVDTLKINNKGLYLELNFMWGDFNEAHDVLQNTMNLVLNNLEVSIFKELYRKFEDKKKIDFLANIESIRFLEGQKWIAEELNISGPTAGYTGEPYYLRGYVAIDKEIELIKNQQYQLEFVKEEINSLKKEGINWVIYDVNSSKVKLLNNTKFILALSILLGLILGMIYVLISNYIQSQAISKKRNK